MAADPGPWLTGEDEFAWRAVKEKLGGAAYATVIRDELRDLWEWEDGSSGACWLFSVREERGFLLQWPKEGGGGGGKH